ncbi:Universal stress protein PHOS34 [Bienertia sinuspersici]
MAVEGRKIGVAMDFSKGSKAALKWAMNGGMLKKGDNLFMIHVQHSQALESRNLMWSNSGSPLIPLAELCDTEVMHGYGVEVEPEVLDLLRTISTQLQVNVVWKLYWGDPREKICEAVVSFHLENLVMGSRGLGALQRCNDNEMIFFFYGNPLVTIVGP